jgi:hypothetical protein
MSKSGLFLHGIRTINKYKNLYFPKIRQLNVTK